MLQLPKTPSSIGQKLKNSFRFYPIVFRQIWWIFLISALVHIINPWFFKFNMTVGWVVFVGFVLVVWFFFAAILWRADAVMHGKTQTYAESFRIARFRYLFVLGGNLVFFVIVAVVFLVEKAVISASELIHLNVLFTVISVIIDSYFFLLIYFAVPLIVIDRCSILTAFEKSIRLVWGHWWSTFFVMIIPMILIILIAFFGIILTGEHRFILLTVYDFFYMLLIYPFIVTSTLVALNDLKIRKQQ